MLPILTRAFLREVLSVVIVSVGRHDLGAADAVAVMPQYQSEV